jgi:hypothetical protein
MERAKRAEQSNSDRASAVLRRSEWTRFSSASDDEVGGLHGAIRAERAEASGAIKHR